MVTRLLGVISRWTTPYRAAAPIICAFSKSRGVFTLKNGSWGAAAKSTGLGSA